MTRMVALLRGVNVGGRRPVEMARLRGMMEALGYREVSTILQSGNVVFTGPHRSSRDVARHLEGPLEATFGVPIQVVARTRDELAEVVRADPLRAVATDPARYHVVFLGGEIDAVRLADLSPEEVAPEAFHLEGREIYLWTPEGLGTSRLARTLSERRLGAVSTTRNWRTVTRLLEMADDT